MNGTRKGTRKTRVLVSLPRRVSALSEERSGKDGLRSFCGWSSAARLGLRFPCPVRRGGRDMGRPDFVAWGSGQSRSQTSETKCGHPAYDSRWNLRSATLELRKVLP